MTRKSEKSGLSRGIALGMMVFLFAVMLAATATAAPKERYSDDGPTGDVITRDSGYSGDSGDVLGGTTEDPQGSALPFTGADITLFVATGLAAIGTGAFIVRRARTREQV